MKKLILTCACLLFIGTGYVVISKPFSRKSTTILKPADATKPTATPVKTNPAPSFDKSQYSITEPASIWFVNNKVTGLPISYVPSDLYVPAVSLRLAASDEQMHMRKVLQPQLEQLFADAKTAGLQLQLGSGYRSASYQKVLYDGYIKSMGQAEADRSSARPGHSEHQTGMALDFTRTDSKCHLQSCFGDLPEGKWLEQNAFKYGFILRYTSDKEKVTGYMYEPWHFRYVGIALATEMHTKGIKTLEEFFGLPAAPDYSN